MKNKSKLILVIPLIALALFILPLINAVTLDSGTILNATGNGASMTFSVPIEVDSATVEDNSITLTNIICSNSRLTFREKVWNTANSNLDSESYCINVCSQGYKTGSMLIMILSSIGILAFMFFYIYSKGGIKELKMNDLIILFVGVIVAVILWLTAGQNLGSQCVVT